MELWFSYAPRRIRTNMHAFHYGTARYVKSDEGCWMLISDSEITHDNAMRKRDNSRKFTMVTRGTPLYQMMNQCCNDGTPTYSSGQTMLWAVEEYLWGIRSYYDRALAFIKQTIRVHSKHRWPPIKELLQYFYEIKVWCATQQISTSCKYLWVHQHRRSCFC